MAVNIEHEDAELGQREGLAFAARTLLECAGSLTGPPYDGAAADRAARRGPDLREVAGHPGPRHGDRLVAVAARSGLGLFRLPRSTGRAGVR